MGRRNVDLLRDPYSDTRGLTQLTIADTGSFDDASDYVLANGVQVSVTFVGS